MLALEIKKQMRIRDFFFYLEEVRPQWEKESRIRTNLQGRYSGRTIIHPKYDISDLEMELLKFPNGKHDDMIDALASAVWISEAQSLQQRKPRQHIPSVNDFL
jgi:phage terminase large subunit-like protein